MISSSNKNDYMDKACKNNLPLQMYHQICIIFYSHVFTLISSPLHFVDWVASLRLEGAPRVHHK